MKTINVDELKEALDRGDDILLVDVRTPQEYLASKIAAAVSMPLTHFDHFAPSLDKGRAVHVMCGSGARAADFCRRLERLGHAPVLVEGGLSAWTKRGYAVEIGPRQTWSIERQVRFGSGALVLLGVVLGVVADPRYFYFSGFIGLGLMVAAVTNFCGMSVLLSKMPWNRMDAPGKPAA